MIIRKAKWDTCNCCKQRTEIIHDEAYGCDECGKGINLWKSERDYLQASIFKHGSESSDWRHYCSWKCCLRNLKKVETDYFINLPLLTFDSKQKNIHAREFWKLMK